MTQTDEKIRTFLAAEVPDNLKKGLADLITRLKTGIQFTGAHPKWVDPTNIHLTLKFFGDTTDVQRKAIVESVRTTAKKHPKHTVRIEGVGIFPNPKQPRVIWAGVKKALPIAALQADIDEAMEDLGWTPEDREFRPHITLARIKSLRRTHALIDVVRGHSQFKVGEWPIGEIVLIQSTLRPEGPIYTPLERFELAG